MVFHVCQAMRLASVAGHFKHLLSLALVVLVITPALAWKPATHVYAANRAIEPILNGYDAVEINGQQYPVEPAVAAAIRNYPSIYRAGVVGPDAFPDIYVGQSFIHPDTRGNNGLETPTAADGHSFSYEWLRHIYQAGWHYYNVFGASPKGQKALAFSYGYLTHAAGDMWAHSLVNDFARGVFPSLTEFELLPIGARHLIVEGYMGKATPPTEISLPNTDGDLSDFVYFALMRHEQRGGFVDSTGRDARDLGRGDIFDFFFDMRDDLRSGTDFIWDYLWWDPAAVAVGIYCEFWIDDIDDGLEAWPTMSQKVAYHLFQHDDFPAAGDVASDFASTHVLSMIGVPDIIVAMLDLFGSVVDMLSNLIEPLKDAAKEFRNFMIKHTTGIDIEELKDYLIHPENHINNGLVGLGPNTSNQLDQLMGRTTPGTGYFNPETFAPMQNTITLSKLILLSPSSLNSLLYDNRVGPLYEVGTFNNDRENAMLGFIRTLDGNQQWRKGTTKALINSPIGTPHGDGMLMWRDCLSRDRLFRTLFLDWQNGSQAFPALGEAAEKLSNTPPPSSSLAINGANVVVSGVHFVGGSTTFTLNAVGSHYWYTNEVLVKGQITPGGSLQSNTETLTVGPIVGADGPYTVTHQGVGFCSDGPDHPGTSVPVSFTLDATPPTITVPVPNEGQWFDVNSAFNLDFDSTDAGSGVASTTATFDGQPILDGAYIDAFLLDAGVHTFVVTSSDLIGNTAQYTRLFEIHATILGLRAAVLRAYSESLITKPTTSKALTQLLDSGQKSFAKGDYNTAANKVAAARDLVLGQIGNGVDATFGNRFAGWCNDLIARLN